MHIYFSGIGGTGIGPLAVIAKQYGYMVTGTNDVVNHYLEQLSENGITDVSIGQTAEHLKSIHSKTPIDWFVYSSAILKENPEHPEYRAAQELGIRCSERGELLAHILQESGLPLIAIAGTHGKTTTTAMTMWLLHELNIPASYSVGAPTSFASMGHYQQDSAYFVYECDEYERNFLHFKPALSLISGIDWDHPDTYPTRESYMEAFLQFINQSKQTVAWSSDVQKLGSTPERTTALEDTDPALDTIALLGLVNRKDALLAVRALASLGVAPEQKLLELVAQFPGVSRRFECLAPNLYTDYAHTAPKIRGAIEIATESGLPLTVVYEGLHNTRQHFMKHELPQLFADADELLVVPSYLAREDKSLALLSPTDLISTMQAPKVRSAASLDAELFQTIQARLAAGHLVLALSAGGAGSLDEWLRDQLNSSHWLPDIPLEPK
jgi:UDP-N-acetylmuramate--alanine ligase